MPEQTSREKHYEKPHIVTVDGPAASGKTSVSRELARRLGWSWVSTGAFYRGLAYVAHKMGVSPKDSEGIAALATSKEWSVVMNEDNTRVIFKGQDVTAEIFQEEVGTMASLISQIPNVRAELLSAQRACAMGVGGLVAEGRDCGTVVFPKADIKIFLTADSEARAHRRALEENRSVEGIKEAQKTRDQADSTRKIAPLKAADGAYNLDTSSLTLMQVVDQIEEIVKKTLPAH